MTSLADFMSLRYSAGGLPLTRAFAQRLGALLAWASAGLGLSPSAITLAGLLVSIGAGILYASLPSGWGAVIACGALFELGYALDCADGQLARATGRASAFGAWLDLACDHGRCVALTIGSLHWLQANGLGAAPAAGAAGLFLAGSAVHIHTAATLRDAAAADPGPVGGARTLARVSLDTAGVLLLLAVLRELPGVLAAYLAAMGLLYLAASARLARRRLA